MFLRRILFRTGNRGNDRDYLQFRSYIFSAADAVMRMFFYRRKTTFRAWFDHHYTSEKLSPK
jgi:hypothetical protein